MQTTWTVRLSSVPATSEVVVVFFGFISRCWVPGLVEPLCGLKKKYCDPLVPEMLPKSTSRAQAAFAPKVAQHSSVTADEPETRPPGRFT